MEIISYDKNRKNEWDRFCLESNDAWFWHTSDWIDYTLDYDSELKSQNFSFLVLENGIVQAICPLILEVGKKGGEFSFGGNYTPSPAYNNELGDLKKSKLSKKIFEHVDELAKKHKVRVTKFKSTALDENFLNDKNKFNFLLQFGFIDVSVGTQIIDLSLSLEDLKKNLRHGHKSDITKAEKNLTFKIFDKDNFDENVFEKYRQEKMKHGSTRPKITFDLMSEFIKRDEAFLAVAEYGGEVVSFSYFFVYKNNAYYGSSVNLGDERKFAVSHGIQWQAMQYMKEKGVKFYEIGWQVFAPGLNDFSSEKEISISKFKRGFGGQTLPLFMAEKYYDKKYFSKVFKLRLKKLLKSHE